MKATPLVALAAATLVGCGGDLMRDASLPRKPILVAVSYDERTWRLIRIEGAHATKLGKLSADSLAWSPDGSHLAFFRGRKLYLAQQDGGQALLVTVVRAVPSAPSWSPNGTALAVALGTDCDQRGRRARIAVVDVRTGKVRRFPVLTRGAREERWLISLSGVRWAQRANLLLYNVAGGRDIDSCIGRLDTVPQSGVWTASARNGRPRLVLRRRGDGEAAWSPSARAIAVCDRWAEGGTAILSRIRAEGRSQRRLLELYGDTACGIKWPRPDAILITRFSGAYAVNPKSRKVRKLAASQWGYPRIVGVSRDGSSFALLDNHLRIVSTIGRSPEMVQTNGIPWDAVAWIP